MSLRTRIYSSIDQVADPATWAALTARGTACVCGARGWVQTALEHAPSDVRPHLIAVTDGDELVGLMPLALKDDRSGTLMAAGAPHNDLIDVMAAPGRGDEVAAVVLVALEHERQNGRRVELRAIDPEGALAGNRHGAQWLRWADDVQAPLIDLGPDWTRRFNPAWASQWQKNERRLHRTHGVRVEKLSPDSTVAAMERFVVRRRARLTSRGWPLDQPPEDFLLRAVEQLAPSGRCALFELHVGDHVVASDLYQLARPVAMLWLRAFDSKWASVSPGNLLVRAVGDLLYADGYTTLDLGRGDERYKFDLGARPRMLLSARSMDL